MQRHPVTKLILTLTILTFSAVLSVEYSIADSIIRITGNKAPLSQNDPTAQPSAPVPTTTSKSNSTIRIIGNKPVETAGTQSPHQEPSQTGINSSDTVTQETINTKPALQTSSIGTSDKPVTTAKPSAESDKAPAETAEHQLAKRLAALKAEEERRIQEKSEQEKLAREKAELINETIRQAALKQEQELLAARKAEEIRIEHQKTEHIRMEREKAELSAEAQKQARIKHEQEQLAARKAEESRKALEKAEQDRLAEQDSVAVNQTTSSTEQEDLEARKADELRKAAMKADENQTNAAQHALNEKPHIQSNTKDLQVDLTTTSVNRFDPGPDASKNSKHQEPSSIWELYQSAKSSDPALGRTEARIAGSKAESDLVFSALLPHLNSSAGVKQISQSLTGYGTPSSSYDYTALNYNATAQMTLLHVPTLYSLSAAAAGLNMEQAGATAARQNLIVKLTDAYFALLKAQTDKQIALGEINRLKQVLDQSQAFLKAGTGDIISVYEAQSRLDSATADLTKSESTLRLAEQKLANYAGKPVSEIINYLPKLPMGPEPDNLDWWVATMEKEQPAIRQARASVTQASEQRKSAKSEYLPILQASGGYDVNRGTAALPTAEVKQWFVGATLTLPLYSGGETSAKVRRASASEKERQHAFEETMDQQRENVKQAFFNLRYNISMIKALDQRKSSAEIQLAAVKKGRKIGTRNAIDVLNAEQSYSVALRDYRYALYDNITRVIQLKSAAGILAESDVSKLSEMEAAPPANGLNLIISMASK